VEPLVSLVSDMVPTWYLRWYQPGTFTLRLMSPVENSPKQSALLICNGNVTWRITTEF